VSVTAVVFDVDGTLIDHDHARREGFAARDRARAAGGR